MQTPSKQLFDKPPSRKALIFVSPGRCGTIRIAEILKDKLPAEEYAVTHQMFFSRLSNVVGNLMYHFGQSEKIKEHLYNLIVFRHINGKHFITTDPLTAMIIPKTWVESKNVCIVQVTRNPEDFAESFFRFSRKKMKSFMAHNLVPFWQLRIMPLENILNRNIKNKYIEVQHEKELFFGSTYSSNPNYIKLNMDKLFQPDFLEKLINRFFYQAITLDKSELSIKTNQSRNES